MKIHIYQTLNDELLAAKQIVYKYDAMMPYWRYKESI